MQQRIKSVCFHKDLMIPGIIIRNPKKRGPKFTGSRPGSFACPATSPCQDKVIHNLQLHKVFEFIPTSRPITLKRNSFIKKP